MTGLRIGNESHNPDVPVHRSPAVCFTANRPGRRVGMTATKARDCHVDVHEATPTEGRALVERRSQELLGVSADRFLKAYRSRRYPKSWPEEAILELEMLAPFTE